MSDDRHLCQAGGGCGSSTVEDGQKQPARTEAPDSLCDGCVKGLEKVLDELPEMWLNLHIALGDKNVRPDQRVSGTRNPPVPLSVDVDAAKTGISEWVSAGAGRVAELMNTTDPSPGSLSDTAHARCVVDGCRLLRTNLDRLLSLQADAVNVWLGPKETGRPGEAWTDSLGHFRGRKLVDMTGIEIGLELKKQHQLARRLLGRTQPREKQRLACPLCGDDKRVYRNVRTIRSKVYDDVECEACNKQWTYTDFQTICNVALRAIEEERMEQDVEELRRRVNQLEAEQEAAKVKFNDYGRRIAYIRRLVEIHPDELNVEMMLRLLKEDVLDEAA